MRWAGLAATLSTSAAAILMMPTSRLTQRSWSASSTIDDARLAGRPLARVMVVNRPPANRLRPALVVTQIEPSVCSATRMMVVAPAPNVSGGNTRNDSPSSSPSRAPG